MLAKSGKDGKAVKAGIGYTVGNMLVKGITFLTIPLFTRLMSTESYGLFNTFNSYMAILTIFIGLALHASIKNAKYDFGEKLPKYTSSMIIIITACALFFGIVALAFSNGISKILAYSGAVILLMVVEAFGNSLLSLYNCVLAIDFRYKEYLGLSFFYSVGSIGASVLLMLTLFGGENSYVGRILGSVIPLVLISAYIIAKSFIKARPTFSETKEHLKYGLAISLPLIPHGLSQILLNQCDRIMIKNMIGDSEAGLYSLAYNIATLYFVLITSADTAWTPWFYERMSSGDEQGIRKNTSTYTALMSFVCIAIFIGGPWLVTIMGGEEYYSSRFLIIPLIYSMFFSFLYTLPVAVEYYYKKTKSVAAATVVSAVVNIVLNYVFILLFGYQAAAYTTAFCHILYFVFHMIMAKKIMGKIVFDMKNILACIGVVTLFGAMCFAFLDNILAFWNFVFFTPYVILPLVAIIVVGVIIAAINRKKISALIKRMKGN